MTYITVPMKVWTDYRENYDYDKKEWPQVENPYFLEELEDRASGEKYGGDPQRLIALFPHPQDRSMALAVFWVEEQEQPTEAQK